MGKRILIAALAVLVAFAVIPAVAAAAISANGSMSYNDVTSESGSTKYHLYSSTKNLALSANKQITNTISLVGNFNLSQTDVNGYKNSTFYPMFYVNFNPPSMYNFTFSYQRTESDPAGGNRLIADSYSSSFSIPETAWPGLTLSYNHNATKDVGRISRVNLISDSYGATLSKKFDLASDYRVNTYYSISKNLSEDKLADRKTDSTAQTVSGSVTKPFWNNKGHLNLNAGYSENKSTEESTGAPSRFGRLAVPNSTLALDSTNIGAPLYATNILNAEPELSDGDSGTAVTPLLNIANASNNFGLEFLTQTTLYRISATVTYPTIADQTAVETAIGGGTYNPGWFLYVSSNGSSWTPSAAISVSYTSYGFPYGRFDFTFADTTSTYFKIVNTLVPVPANPMYITELSAYEYILSVAAQSASYKVQTHFVNFSAGANVTERLNVSYSFMFNSSKDDSNDRVSKSYTNSLGGSYIVMPSFLSTNANYSMRKSTADGTPSTGSNSLQFGLMATPLPTVTSGLNYSWSNSLIDGSETSNTDSISGNASFMIYRGIDLSLNASESTNRDKKTDTTSKTFTYSTVIRLVPRKQVAITIDQGASKSTSDNSSGQDSVSKSHSLRTTASYTPTHSISLTANFSMEPTSSQSYSLSWTPTGRISTSFSYTEMPTSKSYSTSLSWRPIPRLSFSASGSKSEDDSGSKTTAYSLVGVIWF